MKFLNYTGMLFLLFICPENYSQEADTTYWKHYEKLGFNFGQASFSRNWTGGGNNSITFGGLLYGKSSYLKGKIGWDNEYDLQYGIQKNQDQSARKNNDRILLDTKLGYAISKNWNAFTSLNFQSQFDKGYEYDTDDAGAETRVLISGFLAPAYITSSWGAEYKPNDYFSLRISPFSPRITIVKDTGLYHQVPNNYGVSVGEIARYEWFAFKLSASFDKDLTEGINLNARYEFFVNYQEFELKRFDHRFDIALTANIFKMVNLRLASTVLYDFDQVDEIQSSFSTSLSFLFTLGNEEDW